MIEADQIESITAADVRSSDDEKVGSVGQVFLDAQTGRPEWAAVKTGFFGTKEAFVPLRNAEWDGRVVRVAYDKERVKNAPHVDPDNRGLDPHQQGELYTYYGFTETTSSQPLTASSGSTTQRSLPPPAARGETTSTASTDAPLASYREDRTDTSTVMPGATVAATPAGESLSAVAMSELDARDDAPGTQAASDSGLLRAGSLSAIAMSELADRDEPASPAVGDASDSSDDGGAVTRIEEHLEVGVEQHATERVRLRKHIVTQVETVTVTLRREELRIERVPISSDEASGVAAGAGIGESETEIILYEERPVVTTVARPVERIRLTREVVSEEQTVTGDVRKERIEVDDSSL